MRKVFLGKKGQNTLEYAAIIAAIVLALVGARTYLQGRVQAGLEAASDRIEREMTSIR